MKIIRLKYLITAMLCVTTGLAQTSKFDKTFKANKDVTVTIDARHTMINVEYWDRNEVQVSAFLEGRENDGNQDLQSWNFDVTGTASEVKIKSSAAPGIPGDIDLSALQTLKGKVPQIIAPLQEMIGPLLENLSGNPLPPEFYASMGEIRFDYDEYKKDGEKYLQKFEKKMEKNFGADFEKAMEKWAENFEKNEVKMKLNEKQMEAWGEEFGKSMEAWGEEFGKEMEKWGEEFGKEMEVWAADVEKKAKAQAGDSKNSKLIVIKDLSTAKKVLKVKMPRNAQLKLNVRHGEVNLSGTTNNLRGDLTHSKLNAAGISGKNTNLKVSYTPVMIKTWNYGVLTAAYVQDLKIEKAVSLKLDSNSSNVHLRELGETGILSGSFGELKIDRLAPGFKNLDITLENSELELDLPESSYNFSYNGTNSEVKYPKGLKLSASDSYDNQKLKGFNGNQNSGAAINIHASYSDVLLK